jgi:hypothetical protein
VATLDATDIAAIHTDDIGIWRSPEVKSIIIGAVAALLADMTLVPNGDGTYHFKRA